MPPSPPVDPSRAEEDVHALDGLATLTVEMLEQAEQAIAYIFE